MPNLKLENKNIDNVKEKQKISVVVPIYNVEKFLPECIESVLNQTYKNFELILVDDGSTDNSGKICDEYALKDNRVRVIHQKNGGRSVARNIGVKAVKTPLFTFVDGDDYIFENCLQHLFEIYSQTDCDVVYARHDTTDPNFSHNDQGKTKIKVVGKEKALRIAFHRSAGVSVWSKLYKTELFKDIIFPIGYNNEDYAITPKVLGKAKKIAITNQILYYYRINPNGITRCNYDKKEMEFFEISHEVSNYLKENLPKLKKLSVSHDTNYAILSYIKFCRAVYNDKEIEKFLIKFIRKRCLRYVFMSRYPCKRKLFCLLTAISPKIARRQAVKN